MDELAGVIGAHGRGGAHKRSRADEERLVRVVAARLGRDAGGASSLHELWLQLGYGPEQRRALGGDEEALFALEPDLDKVRSSKLMGLTHKTPERRRKGAEWWLKTAAAVSSRRTEALLCGPTVSSAIAAAMRRDQDPRYREAYIGALSMITARFFPDSNHRQLLVEALAGKHPGARFFAVQGLAGLLGRGAEEGDRQLIEQRLKDGASSIREMAESCLDQAAAEGRIERG